MKIKDAVAIITGSSSGIGAAIARLFAEQGCHVVINYSRNEEGARAVATECEALGVKTLVVKANVAEDADCRALVAATMEAFGRLDILINNAGTTRFCAHHDLDGLSKQDFLDIYSVNTVGAYQMARAAEAPMREAGTAHLVNMASIAGLAGVGSSIAYAASKGALLTMTKSLARVLGPQIRVNAICPGFVQGEWLENGLGKEAYAALLEKTKAGAALNDAASPETVAMAVLGLIIGGDLSTGEALLVDGGSHLNASGVRR
ncbi:SDR family NAD(P)-dependent oxidoreductase [Alloalcanivorax mobilis]|uniref:SDR family NAD(P)-dependent oxidoreductase n=1 Tax=Alloalcanivorax mobilis TaxID=2019569 RepID=UPI000B5B4470|nr:SDR family oxidoreductase [Alloalcanivorax mobilis]ASK35537.1 oxidoreductase [Alcanivorax sp. N3-2A]|tara:strand:+ start:46557 stop:47339 length:783 start_codon:yes stop_codon:yes gene_type:complete